jgi:pimeloyl-ACP methyl ester carboxylesterase
MKLVTLPALLVIACVWGCSDQPSPTFEAPDGGGPVTFAAPDAGAPRDDDDASVPDAGVVDELVDAGAGESTPDAGATGSTPDAGLSDIATDAGPLALACDDSLEDVYVVPPGLPPFDASHRGDVVRCAVERFLTDAEVGALAQGEGYQGAPLTSGTTVLRVAYRTERLGGVGGISSAFVFLPDAPRADALPVIVAGHGTVGVGEGCAPSREGLVDHSFGAFAFLPLAGAGWTVIAPDYAGFGYGSTSGWVLAEDEAHSMLDATRALRHVVRPQLLTDGVVLIGHSQGGHAVLASHAYAGSYGVAGTLLGVVAQAPVWFAARNFGAMLSSLSGYDTTDDARAISMGMYYFYTHGEVYDGPGGGLLMFRDTHREAVHELLTTRCFSDVPANVPALGLRPADFFDPSFVTSVSSCAIFGAPCESGAAAVWSERFSVERPSVDPFGAPIVLWQTGEDEAVTPALAQCGIDKLEEDLALPSATTELTICADRFGDHNAPINLKMDWTNQWIAARTLGAAEPVPCAGLEELQPSTGGTLQCPAVPPNDD